MMEAAVSDSLFRWIVGGFAVGATAVAGALWVKMWKKDDALDTLRAEMQTAREADAAVFHKRIDDLKAELDARNKELFEIKLNFEKQHGDTIRKAMSLVMSLKRKRPVREPSPLTRDASTQLNLLTQELQGTEIQDMMRSLGIEP